MAKKIVVVVYRGMVASVYADTKDVEVEVIDMDEEENSDLEYNDYANGLVEVW